MTAPAVVTSLPNANLSPETGTEASQDSTAPSSPSIAATDSLNSTSGTIPNDVALAPIGLTAPSLAGKVNAEGNAVAAPEVPQTLVASEIASSIHAAPATLAPQAGTILISSIIDNIPADGPDSRWYVVTKGLCVGVYDSWCVLTLLPKEPY